MSIENDQCDELYIENEEELPKFDFLFNILDINLNKNNILDIKCKELQNKYINKDVKYIK